MIKNAPLLEPETGAPDGGRRWPTAVFSHGLGGNRNAYSQVAGSIASHGVVVVCPEHRDGSAVVSFVRIPSEQDRYFVRNTRRAVPYRRIPHEATDEIHELRNGQLRVRLWELGLLHEAILTLDGAGGEGPGFANLNKSTPAQALGQFAGRLHVRDPGSIVFMGHSFGAATVVQFLKSVYYADHPEVVSALDNPLYVPAPGSAIRRQVTPRNVTVLLDMWCFPLLAKSTRALFERPLPAYDSGAARDSGDDDPKPSRPHPPGGAAVLAVASEDFFKWKEHLHTTARALSPDPRAAVVEASAFSPFTSPSSEPGSPDLSGKPHFFYVSGAAHLNQSDFGVLFPLLTRRVFGSESPERALRLNLRAILQVLRANGVPVARTSSADLVDGGGGGGGGTAATSLHYDDKLAAAEGADSDTEGDDSSNHDANVGGGDGDRGRHAAATAERQADGVSDDRAIFDCGGNARIDAWEWIDVVGMGQLGEDEDEDEDGQAKKDDDLTERHEPEMAGVIDPSTTNDGEAVTAAAATVAVDNVARAASVSAA